MQENNGSKIRFSQGGGGLFLFDSIPEYMYFAMSVISVNESVNM